MPTTDSLRRPRGRLGLELFLIALIAVSGALAPFYDLYWRQTGGQRGLSLVLFGALGLVCCGVGVFHVVRSRVERRTRQAGRLSDTSGPLLISTRGLIWVALGLFLMAVQVAAPIVAFLVPGD